MSLGLRLGALAVAGIVTAGLAQAGWLGLLWATSEGATGLLTAWVPLLIQTGVTAALAGAVGWQIHRSVQAVQPSLALLRQQADALEQGRFVVVADPAWPDAVPVARSLNAAVRRLQSALEGTVPSGVDALRRSARTDPDTGLDSRFTFLRQLTERLADQQAPETALLQLRLMPAQGSVAASPLAQGDELLGDLAEWLRVYPSRVPGAFAGRLSETDFGLCLPAHGVVDDSASSLMAAASSAPNRLRCVIGGVDHLGGVSLGSALALMDLATADAQSVGAGRIECRSARQGGLPDAPDIAARKSIVDALRTGGVRLGEYPVLDRQGRVLHLECPLRLRLRPGGDFEPADNWLAVASRCRLMTLIDLAGLDLALAASTNDGQGRCVHVSADSLATAGFVSAVRSRLEASPEAAARLWIEISEVSFERLPPRLRNAGTVWRRCGARVGIEHAGAALRSLVRLGEMDLDYIKVDAGFVQGLATDAEQRQRALSLVAFVHELGARVIAEGADEDDDLSALWSLGFDGATGRAATRQHMAQRGEDSRFDQAMSPV